MRRVSGSGSKVEGDEFWEWRGKRRRTGPHKPYGDEFWESVAKVDGDGCWEWLGKRRKRDQRGFLRFRGKSEAAARVAWVLVNGEIPNGMQVLHECDNPPCVRPEHLFLGTAADNADDKTAKGRQAKGEDHGKRIRAGQVKVGELHPNSAVSESDVRTIRERYAAGELQRVLAEEYGVTATAISYIVRRINWKHVK